MSKHNRERRQKASDALPSVNRVPFSLAGRGMQAIKNIGVGSWCPTADGSGPAEAVMLHMTLEIVPGEEIEIGMRMKTARAVDELIAMLERHRNDVWPGG